MSKTERLLVTVPKIQEISRPDVSWIKRRVPVLDVARKLGMRVRGRRATCWRPENHRHGDIDPSLGFSERRNRVRCFVCDMRGGHSNVDLVMGILGIEFGDAVRWIAERFQVPNIKVGRPIGSGLAPLTPCRFGVSGSEWEVVVRSGMWGVMTAAERSILFTLDQFKDPDSGVTRMSYRAIVRYAGVKKMANVSAALKELQKMRALEISCGLRVGITRKCSVYRVTLDDPKFLELCNAVYTSARAEIAQEREYRALQKRERQKAIPTPKKRGEGASTCKGLNLSSPREVHANKLLPNGKREIGYTARMAASVPETSRIVDVEGRAAELERQKQLILQKYAKPADGDGIATKVRPAEVSA